MHIVQVLTGEHQALQQIILNLVHGKSPFIQLRHRTLPPGKYGTQRWLRMGGVFYISLSTGLVTGSNLTKQVMHRHRLDGVYITGHL